MRKKFSDYTKIVYTLFKILIPELKTNDQAEDFQDLGPMIQA